LAAVTGISSSSPSLSSDELSSFLALALGAALTAGLFVAALGASSSSLSLSSLLLSSFFWTLGAG